ncbi:LacI family DNA-binding transcriptional regulator [Metabacillus sediminilitoris]|uniref:LacI family transcriptional regulator n=1 Tax=Metabacillus sediminilitoris TaxID=2567941 RepID=A0A4S4BRK1_9BACI|nr:LacI family DNA-binding transcriptional regulator [Metabacillus sediminilitoris]QGQ46476.1 LacI family DNA-binding transcriptional regulator [Metabacillus sediminilitoris]THF77463.1 LacI family transcriptional regulator [Metabacillus sediminilitoris]
MVTIKDIAIKANVSTATVSYVLNGTGTVSEKTRKRILQIIEDLDYKPNQVAKSLKLRKTKTIGVIVEDITVFNAPGIIDGINEYAEKLGFSILLTNLRLFKRVGNNFSVNIEQCREVAKQKIDELLSNHVDGIIYVGVHPREVSEIIGEVNKPFVCTYCYSTDNTHYSINYDDEQAAYDATNYLISFGHKKIALISGLIDSQPAHARYSGFYSALKQNNLPFHPSFIKTGDWEFKSGYQLTKELLETSEEVPTAIVAMNDLMAGGALEACREIGFKVPEDISIIGIDNQECSQYFIPPLSTMGLPLREMGHHSMETIINILDKKDSDHNVMDKLKCHLIERKSVAAPSNVKAK